MFICIFWTWALCLLFDWYQCTWLDDDGPAASLLPRFTVTSGAQPAFSVSLHYDHPGYHLPQQQVQLLHMVVPQKNLPGCLAQVRTSQYLSLDPCTVTYREVDSLDCSQHMILVHVIVIVGKLYNINTDFFIVSFFFGVMMTLPLSSPAPSLPIWPAPVWQQHSLCWSQASGGLETQGNNIYERRQRGKHVI